MAEQKDLFYLDKVFPEADKIFSESFKSAEGIIKDAIIVLDTNVLLVPFDTSEKNVNDIKNIYLRYRNESKLYVPARVAREFANNRAVKIGDVFLQLRQSKENLNKVNFKVNQYPILENNSDYAELLKEFEKIRKSIKASREHFEKLERDIQSWTWDDNVSQAYKEIFTPDTIIEVKKSREELEKDLKFRITYKVAPGFKDSDKPDDGIGDLLIWQTILELAKDKGKNVVFVTNDQKNDWFYKQDKVGLYPKYELFDEFRRFTEGKSIAIVNFVKFLELSNANAETIQEVKTSIEENNFNDFKLNHTDLVEGLQVEHPKFGKGQVMKLRKGLDGKSNIADISFESVGMKSLLLQFARLKELSTGFNFLLRNPDFDGDHRTYQLLDNEEGD
jgi:rRNA-processing protein FCF1